MYNTLKNRLCGDSYSHNWMQQNSSKEMQERIWQSGEASPRFLIFDFFIYCSSLTFVEAWPAQKLKRKPELIHLGEMWCHKKNVQFILFFFFFS